jgi:hypothetical protein
MNMPGFHAEASVYRTRAPYYGGATRVQDSRSIYPAQQDFCPPWCMYNCMHGCRADGLSESQCGELCSLDCGAYGTGKPLSCGPCVNNVQTCTYCGGYTDTRSCGLVSCGGQLCSPGAQCCGPHCCPPFCCPPGTHCCSDGHGCCPQGQVCASVFGWRFCLPLPPFGVAPLTQQGRPTKRIDFRLARERINHAQVVAGADSTPGLSRSDVAGTRLRSQTPPSKGATNE